MNEAEFWQAVDEWIKHCEDPHVRLSSDPTRIKDCDAYHRIVDMGHDAMPLIRKLYDKESTDSSGLEVIQSHGLPMLVFEIAECPSLIPIDIRGNVKAMTEFTQGYLEGWMAAECSNNQPANKEAHE